MASLAIKIVDYIAAFSKSKPDYDLLILNYHSIVPDGCIPSQWEVVESEFDKQMAEIFKSGMRTIKLSDIPKIQKTVIPGTFAESLPLVCITFDDGFEDNYTLAAGILERYSLTATFSVVSNTIQSNVLDKLSRDFQNVVKNRKLFMTPRMLRDLVDRKFEIVSHTMTHPNLNVTKNADLFQEIIESSQIIDQISGSSSGAFIMSYGLEECPAMKRRVTEVLDGNGFSVAALGRYGYCTFSESYTALDVPRIPIYGSDNMTSFKNKLMGKYWLVSIIYRLVKAFRVRTNYENSY
jgi:peptidoglycan/xylan/chitin deacetylase (PgdA/CDA1 family)